MPACSRICERAPSARDQKPRRQMSRHRRQCTPMDCGAVRRSSATAVGAQHRRRVLSPSPPERIDQMPVLDHVRERLARLDLAAEASRKVGRTASSSFESGHHHVEDRLRRRRRPPARRRWSRTAAAPPRRWPWRAGPFERTMAKRRIGHRDRKAVAQPLAQRDRQRKAGKAGAANDDIDAPDRSRSFEISLCSSRFLVNPGPP